MSIGIDSGVLPFTGEWVARELCGRNLVIYEDLKVPDNLYSHVMDFVMHETGEWVSSEDGKGTWLVEDGKIRILDCNKFLVAFFDGYNYDLGRARISGDIGDSSDAVMLEREPLGRDFRIVISTCKDYMGVALPYLVNSLLGAGVERSSVFAVSGGYDLKDDGNVVKVEGIDVVCRAGNKMGLVGASHPDLPDGRFLMLNDTCSVDYDFLDKCSEIDVSLNPDYICFDEHFTDIGFFVKSHAMLVCEMLTNNNLKQAFHFPMKCSKGMISCGSLFKCLQTECDVYATGRPRMMLKNDLGITKYRCKSSHGAKI